MSDTGFDIPASLRLYDSYAEDPKWQRRFTYTWVGAVALFVFSNMLFKLQRRNRVMSVRVKGVSEDQSKSPSSVTINEHHPPTTMIARFCCKIYGMRSGSWWSPPRLKLNLAQILLVVVYLSLLMVSIFVNAPIISNPNRPGFLAVAQLPVIFLFATKNSVFSLLLGPGFGYEKLNYIHRWSGRFMWLAAMTHGSLWIRDHLQFNTPILGQQKECSGIATLVILSSIVGFSLYPIRNRFYQAFRILHVVLTVSFVVTLCYHTIYAYPWIFPSLALYGLDLLLRLFRYRIRDALLEAVDNQMTIIRVQDCHVGWVTGQYVRIRVIFDGHMFESHPFSIMSAPSSSCTFNSTLVLGARVSGAWTRALNAYAAKDNRTSGKNAAVNPRECRVQVITDGPYGGCSIDVGEYESVLFIAGGSGATFAMGILEDIVTRCITSARSRGERTRIIHFAWYTRSSASIKWFSPMLLDIATRAVKSSLNLRISIFVTCQCSRGDIPNISNMVVTEARPSVIDLLCGFLDSCDCNHIEQGIPVDRSQNGEAALSFALTGGSAVCASGPQSLTWEAQNAVAKMSGSGPRRIALHVEPFGL